jgi:acyl-CoA synthetase (AMP-forming)/AMP-acid ligase II
VYSFSDLAESAPDALAVRDVAGGRDWSRHELLGDARRLSESLDSLEPGTLVSVSAGNAPWMIAALLACRMTGMVFVPLEPSLQESERNRIHERFRVSAILHKDGSLDGRDGAVLSPQATMIKTTSGSTGEPRGVVCTEEQLYRDGMGIIGAMGINPDDLQYGAIRLGHSYGLGNLVAPLLIQGTPLVVQESFDPTVIEGVTVFPGVPFMFEHVVRHDLSLPESLRLLITAGAPIRNETRAAIQARTGLSIHNFYGSSETGGICYDAGEDISDASIMGTPLPGIAISLEEDGRISIEGDTVASGYLYEPSDVFSFGSFRSGDLGEWAEDGRLRLVGRISRFVNVSGRKVDPCEVERTIESHHGVEEVVVLGIPDPARGQVLWAFYRGVNVAESELRRHCSEQISAWKIPRGFRRVEAFPVDVRGKLDRDALAACV